MVGYAWPREVINVLHDSLLELYLNVKIRNFDNTIDSEKVDEELDKLKNVETLTLVEYIKSWVEIVMSMKVQDTDEKVEEGVKERMKQLHTEGKYDLSQSPEEYEKIIQKLEAEVRNHISVQQQMKLYIESYQSKVEELEPLEKKHKKVLDKLEDMEKNVTELVKQKDDLVKEKTMIEKQMKSQKVDLTKKIDGLTKKVKELQVKLGTISV